MKFIIAGLGSIGRRHLRHLAAAGGHDILLCRSGRGAPLEGELADFPVETDLESALSSFRPDGVIISNPTALHLDAAIPAAQAGCHILIEKPISHSMGRVDALRAAVKDSGSRVLVGFQFRYHPGLRKIAALLQDGQIGRPLSVRAHWGEYLPGWHPGEDYRAGYSARKDLGGGVILTLTHPLDYLRMLLGEVEALWAFAGQVSDLELDVEDTAEIGLRFANGVIGSVHLDYNQRPPRHSLEIVCSGGTIIWDNAAGGLRVYFAEENRWREFALPEGFERDDLFRAQMDHFLEVVSGKADPLCTLEDGIRAQALALAAHRSAQTGELVKFDREGN
ncbi:MAG: Gfo/Idh/MocA family oxidoreductase [Anaerolineae bacterium]|nr:Gfo/Idh/MocA family oxidoreductase [Anaerolineae bacterium]